RGEQGHQGSPCFDKRETLTTTGVRLFAEGWAKQVRGRAPELKARRRAICAQRGREVSRRAGPVRSRLRRSSPAASSRPATGPAPGASGTARLRYYAARDGSSDDSRPDRPVPVYGTSRARHTARTVPAPSFERHTNGPCAWAGAGSGG